MLNFVKRTLLRIPPVRSIWQGLKRDSGPAPHASKQAAIRELAAEYGARIFVESGTYQGDMVEAMKPVFQTLYSIELSPELHAAAAVRFSGDGHVELLQGDSGDELRHLMGRIDGPALFWLDGHYSGGVTAKGVLDTPVWAELEHILNAPDLQHVILIDDARLFGRDPAYPTVEAVEAFVKTRRPNVVIDVANDSIRILPRAAVV